MKNKRDTVAEFEALVLRQRDVLWSVCRSHRFSSAWTVDDVFQQVLEALWEAYPDFKGLSSERTWAYSIAAKTVQGLLRRSSNRPQPEAQQCGQQDTGYCADSCYDLMDTVDSLGHPDSDIVRLHLEGFGNADVAAKTGLTEQAVAMRLSRARKKIKSAYYEK